MKVQLLKENLHKATTLAARFITNKAQLPALAMVGIEATKEGVFFSATDLSVGIRIRVGGKVLDEGFVAVPGKLLAELAGNLPLGAVAMEEEGEQLVIVANRTRSTLAILKSPEWPQIKKTKEMKLLTKSDIGDLEVALDRVGYCVSGDEARPALTGVVWELKRGVLAATDGYRLSVVKRVFEKVELENGERMIVGGVFLREMAKIWGELGEGVVELYYDPKSQQLLAEGQDVLLAGRVLAGEYPDYMAIMPKESDFGVIFEREGLLAAVRTAAIFARESAHIVRVSFLSDGVELSANAPQVGSNTILLEVVYEGKPEGGVAFNAKYLLDFLSHATSSRVVFSMSGALKPGLWREEGEEKFVHVIMPVRVREGEE